MILDEYVIVKLTAYWSASFWKKRGYVDVKNGDFLKININDLPKGSSSYVNYKCDNCGCHKQSRWHNLSNKTKHFCKDCSQIFKIKHMNNVHPRIYPTGDKHHNWKNRKINRSFYNYSKNVRRITEENYNKYKEKINPNDFKRTKCGIKNGYQLDHRISVKKGFYFGINPKVIGSLDNLQLLPWKENLLKGE